MLGLLLRLECEMSPIGLCVRIFGLHRDGWGKMEEVLGPGIYVVDESHKGVNLRKLYSLLALPSSLLPGLTVV